MTSRKYWEEVIATAASECDLPLSAAQLAYLSEAAEGGHEHYDMAFYSPPASDRIHDLTREFTEKLERKEQELERYRNGAEAAVCRALKLRPGANVSINQNGDVFRYGGRIEQVL